jgi:hypothetical protein
MGSFGRAEGMVAALANTVAPHLEAALPWAHWTPRAAGPRATTALCISGEFRTSGHDYQDLADWYRLENGETGVLYMTVWQC